MNNHTDQVPSVDLIKSRRRRLHKRLEKSKGKKNTKAYNHPHNLMKVAAYALVQEFLTKRSAEDFLRAAEKLGVTPAPNARVNLFRVAFLVLLKGSNHKLSDGNRSKYAKLLRYAYDHGVDPVWLPPFLAYAGGNDAIIKKLRNGQRERWLKSGPDEPYPKDL